MKARLLMALVVVLSLCGCGAEDLYTSDYACRFVFNTKYHAGTSIETALNGPGMYTMISAGKIGGVWHIYSTLNDGQDKTEDIRLNTAEENYADYSDLGAANGITVATPASSSSLPSRTLHRMSLCRSAANFFSVSIANGISGPIAGYLCSTIVPSKSTAINIVVNLNG